MNRVSVQGDPYWAAAAQNVASMFNPAAEAKGASLLAATRYNNAKAAGVEDQNTALSDAVLAAAGLSPVERAAIRATRPNSSYDIHRGRNENRGGYFIEQGDLTKGLSLTHQASAIDDASKGIANTKMLTKEDGTFNYELAAALASLKGIEGNAFTLSPSGVPIVGPITERGKAYAGQVTNAANESAATVKNIEAKTEIAKELGLKKGETEEERRLRIANATGLDTDIADAVIKAHDARTRRTDAAIGNDKAKTDAAVNSTNTKAAASVEATKSGAAAKPLDTANKMATLRKNIDRTFDTAYAKRSADGKSWSLLDPEEKRSIVDFATQMAADTDGDMVAAMAAAEAAHNVTGKSTEGETGMWFWKDKDGVLKLNGFKPAKYQKKSASPVADAVKEGAGAVKDPAAPVIKTPDKAPVAPTAPEVPPGTPVITSEAEYNKLPVGTLYVAPNGKLLTKK